MINILLTIVCAFLLLVLLGHRNIFKPKNFPPGPLSLPFVGSIYILGTKPYIKLTELKKKYGDIIAMDFGSYRGIVLNDLEVIKKAFSRKEFQTRPLFDVTLPTRGEKRSGIIWSTGKLNEEQRSFMMKSLKTFGLGRKSSETLLMEQLVKLFNIFDNQVGKAIVNKELFNATSVGALWTIVTGESCDEEDEEFKYVLGLTRKIAAGANPLVYFFPKICQLFPKISNWNNFVRSTLETNDFVNKTIESHKKFMKLDEEPRDVVDAYLHKLENTTDPISSFFGDSGKENITSVIGDLLNAGTETVSTALTWLVALLIRHPDKQLKMQAEIDKVIGTDRLPSLADRQKLPYVEAFALEIFRFSSIAPLAIPHETSEDVNLSGFLIPKGTMVIPNIYNALHDPAHWEDPETFNPERFLNEDCTAIRRNVSGTVDIVFGYGKRSCPGEAWAKDELFLFMVGLCQRYTFKPDPESMCSREIEVDVGSTLVPQPHTFVLSKR